jgi:hypothetical protein
MTTVSRHAPAACICQRQRRRMRFAHQKIAAYSSSRWQKLFTETVILGETQVCFGVSQMGRAAAGDFRTSSASTDHRECCRPR